MERQRSTDATGMNKRSCKVTVWELGFSQGVAYEYQAPEGCEVDHGKGVLFQNEVGSGPGVEFEVAVLSPSDQSWSTIRQRGNRSAA